MSAPLNAVTLMAIALRIELMNRYTMSAPLSDCEAIIKAVLEKSASAADTARLAGIAQRPNP